MENWEQSDAEARLPSPPARAGGALQLVRATGVRMQKNTEEVLVCDVSIINWEEREQLLLKILEKHRSNNNQYDCLVPGSGGKDSAMQAHLLKYKYGMNILYFSSHFTFHHSASGPSV